MIDAEGPQRAPAFESRRGKSAKDNLMPRQ
jgi:hypothetical protein